MSESLKSAVIAMDGGGSRCRIALKSAHDLVRVEVGAANVHSDFDGAIAEIRHGLETVATELGGGLSDLVDAPAFAGLAGVSSVDVGDRVRAALPLSTLRVADDRPAALRGALGAFDGAIVHCGTGSFLALQQGRTARLAGGWGANLGDEASAKWIGHRALALTLQARDGTAPDSALAKELSRDLGGVDGILSFAAGATPAAFGTLAPRVTAAAEAGDALALVVMRAGAEQIAALLAALGWTSDMALCLTGGVGPVYAAYLPDDLRRALRAPLGEPLDGALALAEEFANDRR